MDWAGMTTDCGEPFVKLRLASELPLARAPEGPLTTQESTPLALHDTCAVLPDFTRAGVAEIVAFGEATCTEAEAGGEEPPVPEQTT